MARDLDAVVARATILQGEDLHDPIEDEPALAPVFAIVDELVDAAFKDRDTEGLGYCHLMWAMRQELLLQRFGITWFSPSDMNRGVLFD